MMIAMIALQVAAPIEAHRVRLPDILIHGLPPIAASLSANYACRRDLSVKFDASDASGIVELTNLHTETRRASTEQIGQIKAWLAGMKTLVSVDVRCADDGAVVTVTGRDAPRSLSTTQVRFAWLSSYFGLY